MSIGRERLAGANGIASNGEGRGTDPAKMALTGMVLAAEGRRVVAFYADITAAELDREDRELEFLWHRTERVGRGQWVESPCSVLVTNPSLDRLIQVVDALAKSLTKFIADGEDGFAVRILPASVSKAVDLETGPDQ
jgi:hypothetical protein